MAVSLALPVLAASHRGGEWTYGAIMIQIIGEHFRIIIMVQRITGPMLEVMDDDNQKTAYAGAHSAAYAFINTNFGEQVTFDAGW